MKRFLCFGIIYLVLITTTIANATDYNDIYISLDGVNPAPNDVNIIAGTSKTIYIISTVDRISGGYMLYWGTYWGTEWGTNWGNHWDRPWEQVIMNKPIKHPAAGDIASVMDASFDPGWGTSYDYELTMGQNTGLPAGVYFSTVITAIGEPNDKFGIEILWSSPWPLVHEVVFTIVRECNEPYILTINVEPNDVNTIQPGVGQLEYCPGRTIPLIARPYADCPAVYQFDHWVGDVNDVNSASTTVLIDGNKTVTV